MGRRHRLFLVSVARTLVGGSSDVVVDLAQRRRRAGLDLPGAARAAVAVTQPLPRHGIDARCAAAASRSHSVAAAAGCRPERAPRRAGPLAPPARVPALADRSDPGFRARTGLSG